MTNWLVIIICVMCLIVGILAEKYFRVPLGLSSMMSAFIICAFKFDMAPSQVVSSYFPSTIVVPMVLAMAFYSIFTINGTSEYIANRILVTLKGNMKIYPWIMYCISILMYTLLDGTALRYVLAPLIFSVAAVSGESTLMALSTAYLPFVAGSLNPFIGVDATYRFGIITDMGLNNPERINISVWITAIIFSTAVFGLIYIVTQSWKIQNVDISQANTVENLSREQRLSLTVLAVCAIALIGVPIGNIFIKSEAMVTIYKIVNSNSVLICGIFTIILLGLADWKTLISKVSLRPIVMISGVTMLLKTAQEAGLSELCMSVAYNVSPSVLAPVLLLIGAILSFFVAAPTVLPLLYSVSVAIAETPEQAITYIACVTYGAAITGISPISNSGIVFLSMIPERLQGKYEKSMVILAFLGAALAALISATGIIENISTIFVR